MKSCILSDGEVTQSEWILSVVRHNVKFQQNTFLLLEGLDKNDEYVIQRIKLEPSHHNRKKARVEYDEVLLDYNSLNQSSCRVRSFFIQVELVYDLLIPLIKQYQNQAALDRVEFFEGQSTASWGINSSFEASGSDKMSEKIKNKSVNTSYQFLISREGYNCYTWAEAVIEAIGLSFQSEQQQLWKEYNFQSPDSPQSSKRSCCLM